MKTKQEIEERLNALHEIYLLRDDMVDPVLNAQERALRWVLGGE